MSLQILIGVLVLCGARFAVAERTIAIEVAEGLPVTRADLIGALRVRLAPEGAAVVARVTAIPGGVRVDARGTTRDIDLAGLDGPRAARLIALAASDLFLEDLAAAPGLEASSAHHDASPGSTRFSLAGGAAGWDAALGGITLGVERTRGEALFAALEVTGGQLTSGPVQLRTAIARLDLGYRAPWLDLGAGLTVAPISVSEGAGDATVLVGVNARIRVHVPLSSRWDAVIEAGADAFATRTDYRVAGMQVLATPWWAPWIAAGLEVAP